MSTSNVLKRLFFALAGAVVLPFACAVVLDTAQAAAGERSGFEEQAAPTSSATQASLGQLGRARAVSWVVRGV